MSKEVLNYDIDVSNEYNELSIHSLLVAWLQVTIKPADTQWIVFLTPMTTAHIDAQYKQPKDYNDLVSGRAELVEILTHNPGRYDRYSGVCYLRPGWR